MFYNKAIYINFNDKAILRNWLANYKRLVLILITYIDCFSYILLYLNSIKHKTVQ